MTSKKKPLSITGDVYEVTVVYVSPEGEETRKVFYMPVSSGASNEAVAESATSLYSSEGKITATRKM